MNVVISEQELSLLPKAIRDEVVAAAVRYNRAVARLDRLYEARASQRAIDRAEVRAARLEEEYFGVAAAALESEYEEPISQQVALDRTFAELYGEYLRGFPSRHGVTLPELLRYVASEYPGFRQESTDEELIDAARDAYEMHVALRGRRREAPTEKRRVAESLRQRRRR